MSVVARLQCRQMQTLFRPDIAGDHVIIGTKRAAWAIPLRLGGEPESTHMSWADSMRATALAALAGQKAPARRIFSGGSSSWLPQDVWLTRAKQPRERSQPASVRDPASPTRKLAARND